jgi:hypothetical protein
MVIHDIICKIGFQLQPEHLVNFGFQLLALGDFDNPYNSVAFPDLPISLIIHVHCPRALELLVVEIESQFFREGKRVD